MPNLVLFDPPNREKFYPFSYLRPVAEFRVGILTIREKWERSLDISSACLTSSLLQTKFTLQTGEANLYVNGALLPTDPLVEAIRKLQSGESLWQEDLLLAVSTGQSPEKTEELLQLTDGSHKIAFHEEINRLESLPDIFKKNPAETGYDFRLITKGRNSYAFKPGNQVINARDIFLEEGATVDYSLLNANNGPIYLGKNAKVMEGSMIRGPFALGANSKVNMGAKIYEGTTLGPWCKAGGEINNSVFFGFSNKAHDGFLGHSVIGEWCNIGAGTNNSNLKNNYDEVKLWDFSQLRFVKTGETFCGLFLGDHSKCGINTMFNTGTVVGISANIFGPGFPRNFIPSFSWGGAAGLSTYRFDKAIQTATRMMKRRNRSLSNEDLKILETIFNQTEEYRSK